MYTRKLDPSAALDMIKAVRPHTEPNEGFLQQLEIFHQASYKISRRSKPVRMFYMERTVEEVMSERRSLHSSSTWDHLLARTKLIRSS
jgi:dual specificity phosphatase 12